MATVYLAEDAKHNRLVAIKVMNCEHLRDDVSVVAEGLIVDQRSPALVRRRHPAGDNA